jgi:hypothetical protein
MKTFLYNKIQYGYWGKTIIKSGMKISALDRDTAYYKLSNIKSNGKLLRNGDRIMYVLADE